jgi:hypothetical protein
VPARATGCEARAQPDQHTGDGESAEAGFDPGGVARQEGQGDERGDQQPGDECDTPGDVAAARPQQPADDSADAGDTAV